MGIELKQQGSKLQGLSALRAQYEPQIPPALKVAVAFSCIDFVLVFALKDC